MFKQIINKLNAKILNWNGNPEIMELDTGWFTNMCSYTRRIGW
jgi:hypothetical protein